MRTILKTILITGILLNLGIANTQEAKPLPWHPGETIKLEIKFSGPDASKFTNIYPAFNITTDVHHDQPGFTTNLSGTCKPVPPDAFDCDFLIPPGAATGDYNLTVDARSQLGQIVYRAGDQFQLHLFHVENSTTLATPGITVKQLP
jgi:hypothetical protein